MKYVEANVTNSLKNFLYCKTPVCNPFSDGVDSIISPNVAPKSDATFSVLFITGKGSSFLIAAINALSIAVVSSVATALSSYISVLA